MLFNHLVEIAEAILGTDSSIQTSGQVRTGSRTLLVWGLVVVCTLGTFGTLKAMKSQRDKKPTGTATPKPVMTVSTVKTVYEPMADEIVVTGTVRAVDPMAVGAEVNGLRIDAIEVEEGATVRKGQVLARLNSSVLQAQLQQTQARYQGSLAQVGKARQPNRSQDIRMLQAAVSQAKAAEEQERFNVRQAELNYENASKTSTRYNQVLQEGFVTAQESQDKTADRDRNQQAVFAAKQRLQATVFSRQQAEERLDLAQAGGRSEDVQIAVSTSQEVAANIQLLEAQLEQTVIRAPEDGVVITRDAHLGEIASTAKPLFTIARLGQLELRGQVGESEMQRLAEGRNAKILVGGKEITGRIWMISPSVDATTRLGQVRILLNASPHKAHRVSPGMFARATLTLGNHQALVVPSAAVMGESGNYFVYKMEGDRVKKTHVDTGSRSPEKTEVLSGVKADELVVLKGAGFISDGDLVTVSQ